MRPFQIGESDATFNEERRRNWGGAGNYISSGARGVASGGRRYVGGGNVFTGSGGGSSVGARAVASAGAPYVSHGSVFSGSGGGGGGGGAAAAAAAAHAAAVAAQQARSSAALGVLGIGSGQPGSDPKMAVLQSLMHAGNPFGALAGILGASKGTSLSAITKSAQQGQHDAAKLAQASAAEKQVQKLMSGPGNANKAAQAVGQVGGAVKLPNLLTGAGNGPRAADLKVSGDISPPPPAPKTPLPQSDKPFGSLNQGQVHNLLVTSNPAFNGGKPFQITSPLASLKARGTLFKAEQPFVNKSILQTGNQRVATDISTKAQAQSLWNTAKKFYGSGANMPKLNPSQIAPFGVYAFTNPGKNPSVTLNSLAIQGAGNAANAPARADLAHALLHEWTHTRQPLIAGQWAQIASNDPRRSQASVEGGAEAYARYVSGRLGIKGKTGHDPAYNQYVNQFRAQHPFSDLVHGQFVGPAAQAAQGLGTTGKLNANQINLGAAGVKAAGSTRTGALNALNTAAGNAVQNQGQQALNTQALAHDAQAKAAAGALTALASKAKSNPFGSQQAQAAKGTQNAALSDQLKAILAFSKGHMSKQQLSGVIDALHPGSLDEGIDFTKAGAVQAVGPGTIVSVQTGTGWPGGTFIKQKLDKPFEGHQYVYYAENISPNVKPGQRVNTGTPIGQTPGKYPYIEVGWAVPGSADQAQAHTHYSATARNVTPEAQSFQRYLSAGSQVAPHLSNAQHAALQQADKLGGGNKQIAALRAQIRNVRTAGSGGGGQQGAPGLASNLKNLFVSAGNKYGVDPATLYGIAVMETGDRKSGKPFLNPSTSSAGATGWMQFLPSTWAKYGVTAPGRSGTPDPHNVADAVYSAANYLKASGYQKGNPAAVHKAIFAYNHDNSYIAGVLQQASRWQGGAAVAGQSFPSSGASGVSSGIGSAPGSASSSTSSGTSGGGGSVASQASQAAQAASDQQARALQVASSLLGSTSRNRLAQLTPVTLKLGKVKGKSKPLAPVK